MAVIVRRGYMEPSPQSGLMVRFADLSEHDPDIDPDDDEPIEAIVTGEDKNDLLFEVAYLLATHDEWYFDVDHKDYKVWYEGEDVVVASLDTTGKEKPT